MPYISFCSRRMHGVSSGVYYTTPFSPSQTFNVLTLDAAVVAPGPRSPGLAFGEPMPQLEEGMNFCLFNNAW